MLASNWRPRNNSRLTKKGVAGAVVQSRFVLSAIADRTVIDTLSSEPKLRYHAKLVGTEVWERAYARDRFDTDEN